MFDVFTQNLRFALLSIVAVNSNDAIEAYYDHFISYTSCSKYFSAGKEFRRMITLVYIQVKTTSIVTRNMLSSSKSSVVTDTNHKSIETTIMK